MKRQEVLQKLHQQYQELALQYDVAALFLFGSVARDEARPDSDVDLGAKRSLKTRIKDQALHEAIRVA